LPRIGRHRPLLLFAGLLLGCSGAIAPGDAGREAHTGVLAVDESIPWWYARSHCRRCVGGYEPRVKLDEHSTAILRVLLRLSGRRRRWIRADRVLVAVRSVRLPSFHDLLARADWRDRQELADYVRLCTLVRFAPTLMEGRGHFGAVDSGPIEPVFNRCRAGVRLAAELEVLGG